MSTKSRHNGLSSDDQSQIRSAILSSREMLESEFERQLERYGVYDDDRVPLSKLGHLSLQDRETRREIDAALERELEATEDYQRAYGNYIREATKEYLNMCVGLKTIEARGLVTETLTTKAEYGNRSYLHYTVDEIAGELTDTSDDGLGVALDLAFQEIGAEIRILFEDTDYTAIKPEFTVRRDVFDELSNLDDDAWAADEAIGWVYQYFGEKEREEIDERIQDHNYKVQDTDIATKTQLFTPRYIVEYLVDNSLGRMWLEMYGDDTSIDEADNCFYLTPVEESLTDREQKDPRKITVLDPACGGGHFLFYAFDVLYEMYQERTDVVESQIPREILKNNLYGIDIDPGAVQLAALALYLKAKTIEPDVTIEQLNIISADAVLINGERKEQVLNEVELDIEERLIEQIWTSFEHVREWGSLVNIKERVEELIEEEREELEKFQKQGQARLTSDGKMVTQSSFITEQEGEISWEELKQRLIDDAREIANKALEQNSVVDELFAGEVEKSVELLDVLLKEYDVVVSNPPYLSNRKTGDNLKEYVRSNFKGKSDLYAAFIERCLDFAKEDNYVAMVTPENYMFTYSFRGLRKKLLNQSEIVECAHLSGYSFSMKDRPFTAAFVLKSNYSGKHTHSRFYRLTHNQVEYDSFDKKIQGLEEITVQSRAQQSNQDTFVIDQTAFLELPRTPFVYQFGSEILETIVDSNSLGDVVDSVLEGLSTGDDPQFLRCWWEVNPKSIGKDKKYRWIATGGDSKEYYDSMEKVVLWENNGEDVKKFEGSYTRNEKYYGKEGLHFRKFGKYFVTRYHPQDWIFTPTARLIYSGDPNLDKSILGLLCSSLTRYILNILNPQVHFNISAVESIPAELDENREKKIANLVSTAINLRREQFEQCETKFEFDGSVITNQRNNWIFYEEIREATIQLIHGVIDGEIFDQYDLSEDVQSTIYNNVPSNLAKYPHILNAGDLSGMPKAVQEDIPTVELGEVEYQSLIKEIQERSNSEIREIATELEISPYSVAIIRKETRAYSNELEKKYSGKILSYLLGCIFGRWKNGDVMSIDDEILHMTESSNRIRRIFLDSLEALFPDNHEHITSWMENTFGKPLEDWLNEDYFKSHHVDEYTKRNAEVPIYWQLGSENGCFSCYIYYHSLSSDTLPKLRGQYVDAKVQALQNQIKNLESRIDGSKGDEERELRKEIEDLQNQLDDVQEFGKNLDALIDEGFEPDFEAGIWENIQKVDEYNLLQTELDKL